MVVIITYIATAAAIAGTILNAFRRKGCFIIWSVTNTFWLIYNAWRGEYALSIQYGFNLIMAVVGFWQWRRKEGTKQNAE